MRAVYRISPDFWLRGRCPSRSVLMALRSPISLHASPDDDATGLEYIFDNIRSGTTGASLAAIGHRLHGLVIRFRSASTGKLPGEGSSSVTGSHSHPALQDLRFVVVPDDQRPCRSPNRSVPKCPSAIDQMSRRYEDRRNEFKRRFPKSGLHHRSSVPSSMPAPRGHPRSPRPCGPKW